MTPLTLESPLESALQRLERALIVGGLDELNAAGAALQSALAQPPALQAQQLVRLTRTLTRCNELLNRGWCGTTRALDALFGTGAPDQGAMLYHRKGASRRIDPGRRVHVAT